MRLREKPKAVTIARCTCGSVELEAVGTPFTSTVCCCDTCQEGSRRLGALPNAAAAQDADGGTAYSLFRKDRVRYSRGSELLRELKLTENTATVRVYAGCCNAPMVMKFEDARHWVCVYRARLQGTLPPLQFRICTKFRPNNDPLPNDVPSSEMYPPGLMMKLLGAKIAMLLKLG